MTKTGQKGLPMSNANDPKLRKKWLSFLSEQLVHAFRYGNDDEVYTKRGTHIQTFLENYGFPRVSGGDYLSVRGGISQSLVHYIKSAPNQQRACGTVLWEILDKAYPKENSSYAKTAEGYRGFRREQCNLVRFLGDMHLDLSAKDKINALDFLGYKYSTDEYRNLYNQLGNYTFGENPADLEYEKKQTVKLLNKLNKECTKSTAKDKIISAREFLKTVSNFSFVLDSDSLEGAVYHDDKNDKDLRIDAQSKANIYAVMKNMKNEFPASMIAYYSGKINRYDNIKSYLGSILNKHSEAKSPQYRKDLISHDFGGITLQLTKQNAADAEIIDKYSSYLSLYASWHPYNKCLNADLLKKMLEQEAHNTNEITKAEILFPDYLLPKELPTINKALVMTVAQNYADSFVCSQPEAEEFNAAYHQAMTKMFSDITVEHNYSKSEVQALCKVLSSNGDEATKKMGKHIMSVYTAQTKSKPYRGR